MFENGERVVIFCVCLRMGVVSCILLCLFENGESELYSLVFV